MAEAVKVSKKPMHPPFPRMVCESLHGLDATIEGEHHAGHSMHSIKKYMEQHYKVIMVFRLLSSTQRARCVCLEC